MCGHAVIALGRYAIDYGMVKPIHPETPLTIQCPCGPVKVKVQVQDDKGGQCHTGAVSYEGVPSFVVSRDQVIEVKGIGSVVYDLCFGGAFYAFVESTSVGIDVSNTKKCVEFCGDLTDVLRKVLKLTHPESSDLAFLYGTILYHDGKDGCHQQCVFAERQVRTSSLLYSNLRCVTSIFMLKNIIKIIIFTQLPYSCRAIMLYCLTSTCMIALVHLYNSMTVLIFDFLICSGIDHLVDQEYKPS